MIELTPDNVQGLFDSCCMQTIEGAFDDQALPVNMILSSCRVDLSIVLDRDRIQECRQDIIDLLSQLPGNFKAGTYNGLQGRPFFEAMLDRHGHKWTDSQEDVEMLFVLGMAANKAAIPYPLAIWPALPDGLPHLLVLD